MKCPAPRPTTTSPPGRRSIPRASRSWATASAATRRRASPRSRNATPPQSHSAPCTGASTSGSPATRRGSRPIPARARPRSFSSAGWWAPRTTRLRSNGRRSSRSKASRIGSSAPSLCCTARTTASSRLRKRRNSTNGSARSANTSRYSLPRKAAPSTARSITASSASITSATGSSPTCSRAAAHRPARRCRGRVVPRRRESPHVIQWRHKPANGKRDQGGSIMFALVRWCSLACVVLGAPAMAQTPSASSYPDRPIRLVVAFPPGGATDTMTRQITQELGEALGQSVVIENKPGAGGYVAWNHVATSEPDGYTLLMAENAIGISQALYKKTQSFDPVKQYDAIATVATSPLVLAVANNVKANSVAELIAYSRTVPEKINYASAGIGSVSHLTFEVIKASTGMEAVHVPYKGGGPAMNDVIAGHVALNMAAIQVAKGLVESGKIKGLAVTSAERSPVLPNVPTMKEAGVKTADVDLRFWFGIFGPKGIPDAVKVKLEKAVATTLADPRVRERLAKLDIEPDYAPGSALKAKLENEIANWTRFIDAHGIKPE